MRGPRGLKWIIIVGIFLIVVAASNWIPIPIFWAYQPGPVRDIESLVVVDETETYSSEGRLMLTTVNVDVDVTLADWMIAIFDPDKTIVLKDDVTGGQTLEDLERQQLLEMDGVETARDRGRSLGARPRDSKRQGSAHRLASERAPPQMALSNPTTSSSRWTGRRRQQPARLVVLSTRCRWAKR